MNNKLPTPITILGSLLLAGILAACLPTSPAVSQMQVSPVAPSISQISTPPEPTQTPLPTKPPVYQTTKQPSSPTQGSLNPSSTLITPSITDVPVPVITPNVRIGNGIATSMAVSPDGRWLTVGTQFGVYQYQADTFERAWFTPLKEYAAQVSYDPQGNRLGVSVGSDIILLDPETGKQLVQIEKAGWFSWSPDGQRLVSGNSCEIVRVWNARDGAMLKELRGNHCSEGYSGISVTWGADNRIYAASMGTKILAWDASDYSPIENFSAKGAADTWIDALLAAPSGSLIAQHDSMGRPVVAIINGQQDRQIQLLDQQVNGPISALAWALDGERLAVAYGMDTQLILIWNAHTGQIEEKIEGIYSAAHLGWSPDGTFLYALQGTDHSISAIDVKTGQVLRSFNAHAPAGNFLTWTEDGLISSDGINLTWWDPYTGQPSNRKAVGSPQAWVNSWPPTGPSAFLFTTDREAHFVGSTDSRQAIEGDQGDYPFPTAWSWDGARLADATHIWDAKTGALLTQLENPAQQHTPDQVAWSPDGTRLASADSLNLQSPIIWDAKTGKVIQTLSAKTGGLTPIWFGLAWSPNEERLAAVGGLMHPDSGADEGMILTWDAQTGTQTQLLTAGMHGYRLWTVAWSPDSRFLACGTTGHELFIWDMIKGVPLAQLEGHTDMIDRLAWSPDGHHLTSVARDGTLQIWYLSQFAEDLP